MGFCPFISILAHCCLLASFPDFISQPWRKLHGCEIKSGSGLGTRLVVCTLTLQKGNQKAVHDEYNYVVNVFTGSLITLYSCAQPFGAHFVRSTQTDPEFKGGARQRVLGCDKEIKKCLGMHTCMMPHAQHSSADDVSCRAWLSWSLVTGPMRLQDQ